MGGLSSTHPSGPVRHRWVELDAPFGACADRWVELELTELYAPEVSSLYLYVFTPVSRLPTDIPPCLHDFTPTARLKTPYLHIATPTSRLQISMASRPYARLDVKMSNSP